MENFKSTTFQKNSFFTPRFLINSLFGLLLFIVIAFNIFSFFQISKSVNTNQLVIHSYRVLQAVNEVFLNLQQVESEARNGMAQAVAEKETAMNKSFALTKALTMDNITQQNNLRILEPLLNEKIDLIKKNIQPVMLKQNRDIQINAIEKSDDLSQKISSLIHDICAEELYLLGKMNIDSLDNLSELHYVFFVRSILSILFFIFGAIIININLAKQERFVQEKRRYENLLTSVIDGTNDIIWALDLDFRFMIFNHSFEREFKSLFGKRPVVGVSIIDLLFHLPEEQEKITALWKRALQGEEFSLIGGLSSTRLTQVIYECNFNSIFDENGKLIGAAAICRNIEHRIETEKFLKNTNEKLEHAYTELKKHDTEVSILNEMENSLQSCHGLSETFIIIRMYCKKLFPFASGVVYLLNASGNYLEAMTEWNNPVMPEKIFSPNQCWSLRQGKSCIYINNSDCLSCEHMHDQNCLSYLCVPLLAQNDIIGMLHIQLTNAENYSEIHIKELFKQHDLLINNLAVQLALAIANIQLRETLKRRSIRDPLTGLYNRVFLNEFVERDFYRAEQNNVPVSIVMMDVDNFKRLNDKYGHDGGDMVLKELGKLLEENIRGSDITCRYGGEEFLIIFYDTDIEVACERIEKLRKLISRMEVSLRETVLDKITASFGLALFPKNGKKFEALITAADVALFQSKKSGRNRLTVYNKSIPKKIDNS